MGAEAEALMLMGSETVCQHTAQSVDHTRSRRIPSKTYGQQQQTATWWYKRSERSHLGLPGAFDEFEKDQIGHRPPEAMKGVGGC